MNIVSPLAIACICSLFHRREGLLGPCPRIPFAFSPSTISCRSIHDTDLSSCSARDLICCSRSASTLTPNVMSFFFCMPLTMLAFLLAVNAWVVYIVNIVNMKGLMVMRLRHNALRIGLTAAFACLGLACHAATVTGTVTRIIDGDTIAVMTSAEPEACVTIRLAEIDAPERDQHFGQESARFLCALILDKKVCVEYSKKDFFGRIIGTVYILAGDSDSLREVNRMLIAGGYAWVYRKYSRSEVLVGIEAKARSGRTGLWREKNPVPPWKHRRAMRSKGGRQR